MAMTIYVVRTNIEAGECTAFLKEGPDFSPQIYKATSPRGPAEAIGLLIMSGAVPQIVVCDVDQNPKPKGEK